MFCSKIQDDQKFNKDFGDIVENQIYEANNRDGTLLKLGDNDKILKNEIDINNQIIEFKNFMSWIYTFFFALIVCFVIYDLITYIRNKNKENQIEKEYCLLVNNFIIQFLFWG